MIYLTNLNLNKNEVQNAVIQPLAAAPSNPKLGQIYYNSSDKVMYQYNGTAWKAVGVLYSETSVAGKVLSGLAVDGTVSTAQVVDLQLVGYTPVTDGYVTANDSLGVAIKALDQAVKNAVAGGGEINQYAFSKVKVGQITINSTGKTDTLELVAGDKITLTADASTKKVTIATNIPAASTTEAGLMSSGDKSKLDGIASGAQVNVQSDWNQTNTSSKEYIKNKPTKLSDFTNDENFIDNTVANLANYYQKTETYTQTEVNNLIGGIATIQISAVASLPATGQSNIIYLVPKTGGSGTNVKDEYLWTGSAFEKIGDTEIDLSSYQTLTGNLNNNTVSFTAATSRANIATGEKMSVILGKVAKYFTDLKTVAFSGSYSDLSNKPTIIKSATGTISAGATTADVSYTGTFLGASAKDSTTGEVVFTDIVVASNKVTFTISAAYTNSLNLAVLYV